MIFVQYAAWYICGLVGAFLLAWTLAPTCIRDGDIPTYIIMFVTACFGPVAFIYGMVFAGIALFLDERH